MEDKFKNKYRIPSIRLSSWDYGSHGLYFVTICTKDRVQYFGNIVSNEVASGKQNILQTENIASLKATEIGVIANQNWLNIPNHFDFVELDEYIVMPNHIHGILFINKPHKTDWRPNKFGPQSQNLGSVLRGYKASVKTFATTNNIEFAWQARFHDRIIRNEKEYNNIRGYIFDNPQQWLLNGDNFEDFIP
jgi:putative transposase